MYSFKDRLIDWINGKGAWTHIFMAVGIALAITAIVMGVAMPSKSGVSANGRDIAELHMAMGSVVGQLGLKASQEDLDDVIGAVGSQAEGIYSQGDRLAALEAAPHYSPAEAYLTGTFGTYTLHISGEPGNYTANIHMVYQPAIGDAANYTAALDGFYAGINFTGTLPAYVPIATFNGTSWGISEVWFNIGAFTLTEVAEIPVTVALNSTPSFVYVEVYPI